MSELTSDLKRDSGPTHTVGAICPLFLMKRYGEQKIYIEKTRYRVVPFVTGVEPFWQKKKKELYFSVYFESKLIPLCTEFLDISI